MRNRRFQHGQVRLVQVVACIYAQAGGARRFGSGDAGIELTRAIAARKRRRIVPAEAPKALTAKQYEALRARLLAFRDKVHALAGEPTTPAGSAFRPTAETA